MALRSDEGSRRFRVLAQGRIFRRSINSGDGPRAALGSSVTGIHPQGGDLNTMRYLDAREKSCDCHSNPVICRITQNLTRSLYPHNHDQVQPCPGPRDRQLRLPNPSGLATGALNSARESASSILVRQTNYFMQQRHCSQCRVSQIKCYMCFARATRTIDTRRVRSSGIFRMLMCPGTERSDFLVQFSLGVLVF